jgi:hypothetical protein
MIYKHCDRCGCKGGMSDPGRWATPAVVSMVNYVCKAKIMDLCVRCALEIRAKAAEAIR